MSERLLHPEMIARSHIPCAPALPPHSLCSMYHLLSHICCWQLLGQTAICSYLCSLNPIVNILILNPQPFQWWELSFGEGRWAEVNRSKASPAPGPKHTLWPSCLSFLPLFGMGSHLELKADHSLLFVCCCQVRPSGIAVHRISLAF